MAAQDNLSNELFFEVHRGVSSHPDHLFRKGGVGMHWSADKSVAETFAVDNNNPGETKPYVFHAEVPISSVETNSDVLRGRKVGGEFDDEKEVPVRFDKPIRITGRTTLRKDKGDGRYEYSKSRTRRYNPPREATA